MPTVKVPTGTDAFYDTTIGSEDVDVGKIEGARDFYDNHKNRQALIQQIKAEITAANSSLSTAGKLNCLANALGLATITPDGVHEPFYRKCVFYLHPDPEHAAYEHVTGAVGGPTGNIKKVVEAIGTIRGHLIGVVTSALAGTQRDQFLNSAHVGTTELIEVMCSSVDTTTDEILEQRSEFYKLKFFTDIGNTVHESDTKTVRAFSQAVIAFERLYGIIMQSRNGTEPKHPVDQYQTFQVLMQAKTINTRFSLYLTTATDLKAKIPGGFQAYCRALIIAQSELTKNSIFDNGNEKDSAAAVNAVHRPQKHGGGAAARPQRTPKSGEKCSDCGSKSHLRGFAGDQSRPKCEKYDPDFGKKLQREREERQSRLGYDRDRAPGGDGKYDRSQRGRDRERGRDHERGRGRECERDRPRRSDNIRSRSPRRGRSSSPKRRKTAVKCKHGVECKNALKGCKFDHGDLKDYLEHHSKGK
jgi:hypothetical protein